jgi:hypothetical protein
MGIGKNRKIDIVLKEILPQILTKIEREIPFRKIWEEVTDR